MRLRIGEQHAGAGDVESECSLGERVLQQLGFGRVEELARAEDPFDGDLSDAAADDEADAVGLVLGDDLGEHVGRCVGRAELRVRYHRRPLVGVGVHRFVVRVHTVGGVEPELVSGHDARAAVVVWRNDDPDRPSELHAEAESPMRHPDSVPTQPCAALNVSALGTRGAPMRLATTVNLRVINVVVGFAHLAQAALMLALSNDLALPVTASWATGDPVVDRMPSAPEEVFALAIGPAVALFLLLAAVDHLAVALPGIHPWYERRVEANDNYLRWVEYSVSASLMMVLIARFVGIADLAALLGVFALTASMILFGLLMERQQRPGSADWSAFWFGSLAGVVPWIAVAIYIVNGASPPAFVYVIVAVQFVFFFSFAANMALQYLRVGRWREYRFGEVVYMLLSLGAKSALAWLVFANVLRT